MDQRTDDKAAPAGSVQLHLRQLAQADYDDVHAISKAVYPDMDTHWTRAAFNTLITDFPEGQIGIEEGGRIVAAAFAVIVDYRRFSGRHSYEQVTAGERMTTHDPNGDALYGIEVFVHPDYRAMRLGRRLYDARKELCYRLNLRAILIGGRIPRYHQHAGELSPHDYIAKVSRKEIHDPILNFQLANDFEVKRLLSAYMPEDEASAGHAVLLEWSNIYYRPSDEPVLDARKEVVRVGTVQWQMRSVTSVDQVVSQAEYFVDAMSAYEADFTVFPEFYHAALLGLCSDDSTVAAIRELAAFTETLRDAMADLAVRYNTNIIAGSMPLLDGKRLYNVAYLCRRDGSIDAQYKLHVTPNERDTWVMSGGDRLRVFDTDAGRIGILICYDVEFPELARLQAEHGMEILFVPFWTDTKNGYLRVRRCAQARAIENECYVAISGSVGNLPKIDNAEIQYAQSAVFTPSDFNFPHDAVLADATPNTEMTLISDLDLTKLEMLRARGSVRNFRDRRRDLYSIQWRGKEMG
ncbi:MAG: GNAT family N-acetyltransferase [Alphaproteobacteria bacterium]|nr:MAG: GNAT family N-acetyltransferase [Alphaproteobacteria bacterium]